MLGLKLVGNALIVAALLFALVVTTAVLLGSWAFSDERDQVGEDDGWGV